MDSRFVRPESCRLQLTGGDWIVVRKRLNTGEKREAFGRMYLTGADGATLQRHPVLYGIHMVCAYLLDWSFTDDSGKPMIILDRPIDEIQRAVDNLDPDDFDEIQDAIETHRVKVALERAEAKKTRGGVNTFAATSPSPSAAVGPLSTSEA